MIKYVRTMNGHLSAPETVRIPIDKELYYSADSLYEITNSTLCANLRDGYPKYLALESNVFERNRESIECVRITPGMILDCTAEGTFNSGDLVGWELISDQCIDGVTTGGNCLEVLGAGSKDNSVKVLVLKY